VENSTPSYQIEPVDRLESARSCHNGSGRVATHPGAEHTRHKVLQQRQMHARPARPGSIRSAQIPYGERDETLEKAPWPASGRGRARPRDRGQCSSAAASRVPRVTWNYVSAPGPEVAHSAGPDVQRRSAARWRTGHRARGRESDVADSEDRTVQATCPRRTSAPG